MSIESPKMRIIKLHKKWADGFILIWQLFVIFLFGGLYIVISESGVAASERDASLILLATVIIVAAIWQAAALTIARIHMLLEKVDLETPARGGE